MNAARMANEPSTTTSSLTTNSSVEMAAAVRPAPRVMYEVFWMGEPGRLLMIDAALFFGSSREGVELANRRPEAAEGATARRRAAVVDARAATVLRANDMAVTWPCSLVRCELGVVERREKVEKVGSEKQACWLWMDCRQAGIYYCSCRHLQASKRVRVVTAYCTHRYTLHHALCPAPVHRPVRPSMPIIARHPSHARDN
jgi:hypothetical protein